MVLYEKKERVAYITLNRPEKFNAIDRKTTEELIKVWADFKEDNNLWVAILNGKGKSFCAGADLSEMEVGKTWSLSKSLLYGERRMGPSNQKVWKPLIAAVHGLVLGAGLYLTLESDFRIASEEAEFGLPEPRVSLPTLFTPFLSQYLLHTHALELLLIGDRVKASRAYEIGLVNRVVPLEGLLSTAEQFAHRMCENGPLALRAMKEAFYSSRGMEFSGVLKLMEEIFAPVFRSGDAVEGKSAFLEKRKPKWKGK